MLRVQTEQGWWLITHRDHARLAAAFAARWGNALFAPPRPRAEVLEAISAHDDGWVLRDAHPGITREHKPSAFSEELVGKYSAFEEIDFRDYLTVRASAHDQIQARCSYAALLVSMHTYNLLTKRADRSTIAAQQLPLLDAFLAQQLSLQERLRLSVRADSHYAAEQVSDEAITNNFRLLQATDSLSLLGCVDHRRPATLLHPLPTSNGRTCSVDVFRLAPHTFQLQPYPLDEPSLRFDLPARHIVGHTFSADEELQASLASAVWQTLTVTITA